MKAIIVCLMVSLCCIQTAFSQCACQDKETNCDTDTVKRYCKSALIGTYVRGKCPLSCGVCKACPVIQPRSCTPDNDPCRDFSDKCAILAPTQCNSRVEFIRTVVKRECPKSCGLCKPCQTSFAGKVPCKIGCRDKEVQCIYWAKEGHCNSLLNGNWMKQTCPESCSVCRKCTPAGSSARVPPGFFATTKPVRTTRRPVRTTKRPRATTEVPTVTEKPTKVPYVPTRGEKEVIIFVEESTATAPASATTEVPTATEKPTKVPYVPTRGEKEVIIFVEESTATAPTSATTEEMKTTTDEKVVIIEDETMPIEPRPHVITSTTPRAPIGFMPQEPTIECQRGQTSATSLANICLNAHNYYRCLHNSVPLEYDLRLQASAMKYARKLAASGVLEPSTVGVDRGDSVGENIAMGSTNTFPYTVNEAVAGWYAESLMHDYGTEEALAGSEHFTQMIWNDTRRVGCAERKINGKVYVVAHYDVDGNQPDFFLFNVDFPHPDTCVADCPDGICQGNTGRQMCKCEPRGANYEGPLCGERCVVTCSRPAGYVGEWRKTCEGSNVCTCADRAIPGSGITSGGAWCR